MEQFNLNKWLKDKSRKVVTRSGHNVRILCTDQRGNMPIVALVEFETLDGVQIFYSDGKNESHREYDLFFADEEEELTEFDYAVLSIISDHNSHTDSIESFAKRNSKKLLDLTRKELLKDLPKWKKCVGSTGPFIDDFRGEDYLYLKDYVIKVSELFEKLPKEE